MHADPSHGGSGPLLSLRGAVAWSLAAFIVLTISFGFAYRAGLMESAGLVAMRAGTLVDLVQELPRGRQALVSCVWLMPLPTLASLPFVFFLPATSYGLAYLYCLATAGALAVVPLRVLFSRMGLRMPGTMAFAIASAFCILVVGTVWADTIMVMACLAGAIAIECSARPGNRAMAGFFYAAASLAHPVGLAWAWLRILFDIASFVFRRSPEQRAIAFIRFVQIAYACGIYLFLNAMVMRQPAYPFTKMSAWPTRSPAEAVKELDGMLRDRYDGFAHVASGPWGYIAQDVLARQSGYHVLDFHPDKVPSWEQRDVLLIVPAHDNPLSPWQDTALSGDGRATFPGRVLLLGNTRRWLFYLVSPGNRTSKRDGPATMHEDGAAPPKRRDPIQESFTLGLERGQVPDEPFMSGGISDMLNLDPGALCQGGGRLADNVEAFACDLHAHFG